MPPMWRVTAVGVRLMPRLFIGLELPNMQAGALAALAEPASGLHWQTPAQLHLTLRFLGELSNAQSCEVQQALSVLCWQALDVQVSGVGYFGSPARPSILWAGVADNAPLHALRAKLDLLSVTWLAPDSRRFVPHVTLARCGSGVGHPGHFLARHRQLELPSWRVSEICLFTSEASDNGSRYRVIARYSSTLPLEMSDNAPDQAP